ncbi:hypothetical protein G7A72_14510 [Flavobacterium sp. Sr18]|uniref:hypothetical protein n=1 Tax=Flavobacterium sp. Sr18 TaxID=935222 RepID=UPI0013E46442|nr:hypothetical protein [Flavobacterium sp. Sr18]QIH39953.1 hypothetical protein G7A72_14510 [Flavobacterium sp. Sr18]
MANIIDYIKLSSEAKSVTTLYTSPDQFLKNYLLLDDLEQMSYINHFIVNNVKFAFKNEPLLYENLTQYLGDKLNISKDKIKLIGSAKTGFSISPNPDYGKKFSEKSDLDFAIIDEGIFSQSVIEYKQWKKNFDNGIYPQQLQNKYWKDNFENLKHQCKRGFIDTYKIPNYTEFKTTQGIDNSLSLIVANLDTYHNIKVKNASARIYKDWNTFFKQLRLNTESVLSKIN